MAVAPVRTKRSLSIKLDLQVADRSSAITLHFPNYSTTGGAIASGVEYDRMLPVASNQMSISDFDKLGVLGSGNGGTVYKARHRITSEIFALKLLHRTVTCDAGSARQIRQEADVLRRTAGAPGIVRCTSVIPPSATDRGSFAFVLEYMDLGTLESLYRRCPGGSIAELPLREITLQALLGLLALHSGRIVHRDVKPSNFLVSSSGQVKISDFGLTEIVPRKENATSSNICELPYSGTAAYMSPERYDGSSGGHDGFAADVWGFGITLLELYLGRHPMLQDGQRRPADWASLMWSVCFSDPPVAPESSTEEFKGFVGCCLKKEPAERWTVERLLTHPFVTRSRDESRTAFLQVLAGAGSEGLAVN